MDLLFRTLGTAALALTAGLLWRARRHLRGTTLTTAWGWAAAAWGAWSLAWLVEMLLSRLSAGAADQAWYGVSILMLCPPVAVLGARRPGARVWTWFVLLPLVLVFAWPALTEWNARWRFDPLRLQAPVALGYGLVLVMGLGNYFGTRYTLAVTILAAALILLIVPVAPFAPAGAWNADRARGWATLLLGIAAGTAWLSARPSVAAVEPLDRVWIDFRDLFGVVWAKRFLDRVNDTAQRERWSARLAMHGLDWLPPADGLLSPAETLARADHAFRWLLRRFADPAWIDWRLGRE